MIGLPLAVLRGLIARPALRKALLGALVALAVVGAVVAVLARVRANAAAEARRELDAQQSQEVKDAITRSAPGPRPSGSEFVDCLRRAGPGCL